jgi:hypothetical protein
MLTLATLHASIVLNRRRIIVVGDLEKLSRALSDDTPEKQTERELKQKASEIEECTRILV